MNDPRISDDHSFTRRQALAVGALGAGALLGLPGCGSSSSSSGTTAAKAGGPASFKGDTINLFTWSSYHEKPWLEEYEKLRGVKVNVQLYGSVGSGFAKVKSNPSEFDLVLATSNFFEEYVNAGLVVPFDLTKVPNSKNVLTELAWKKVLESKGTLYGMMYNWGDEPLTWVPGKAATPAQSWKSFYDPQYKGKVSIVDDPPTVMPFLPLMLGFQDPYNLSSSQFKQMKEALMKLRGQITHVSASIEDQTTDFANGNVVMGMLYNISTQVALRKNGIKLQQVIPAEGAPGWSDNYAITHAGAQKSDLIYDFINYTMSVPWQARFAAETSNTGVLTLADAKSAEAVKAGMTPAKLNATLLPFTAGGPAFFSKIKIGAYPNVEEWLNVWNEFKAGLG